MKTSGRSDAELVKAARHKNLPRPAWVDGEIEEVIEDISQKEKEMFKCRCSFLDAEGEKWTIRVNLVDEGKGALLLRRLCTARGVAEKYDAGSVDSNDLLGPCRMKIGIQKRRGWPDRLIAEDFAPPASSPVVNIRAAG
jgi:hypothetical protein